MVQFREQQQFRQPWLWIVFAAVSLPLLALLGFSIFQQVVLGEPVGNQPVSDFELIGIFSGVLLLHTLIIGLFWIARLDVAVTQTDVTVRFRPFHLTPMRIPLRDIVDARARDYSALGEYGGWGIRVGLGGRAYNVSGTEGVQLTLANGKEILIGSQKSSELEAAIRAARS